MHIISVNMSAVPQCQVGEKQELSDKWDCIILGIATLATCNCFFNIFQHLTLHTDISDNYTRNVCHDYLSPDIFKTQHSSHCETMEQWDRQQAAEISMWRCSKKPTSLWLSVTCRWDLLHWHVDIPEQNGRFCASQQLLFLLTNEMTCSTFLCILCGSLNRLLTVWQCTEILLYSNRWGVLQTHSKVIILRYLLLLFFLLIIVIIIIIIITTIFSADPQTALQKDKTYAKPTLY